MTAEQIQRLSAERPFPGLNVYEDQLARKFLEMWYPLFDEVRFQAHVGGGIDPGPPHDDAMRRMFRFNSQKRLDMVLTGPFGVFLVEIKHRLEMAALGQLLGYRYLWLQEHRDPQQHVEMVALGFEAGEDVAAALAAHNVRVILFERADG
jgi:hypothetical protein